MSSAPVVAVLSTGGTIASQHRTGGVVPVLTISELLGSAHDLPDGTSVRTREVLAVDSSAITPDDQQTLLQAVRTELADPDVVGVVVTHGTDTLEESAMFVDLSHDDARPVVFTGAQYPADSPTADGPANLAAALACAADPVRRDHGTLVAFGGRVLPARGVYKATTTGLEGFESVATDLARPLVVGPVATTARVDIAALYPGFDPALIGHLVDAGATGLVLVGLGAGNAHPRVRDAVARAVSAGVTVVVSSRVPRGEVVATYGGGGGAVDLAAAGAIISPWLRPPQARVALGALLATGVDRDAVDTFFSACIPTSG